VPIVGPTGVSKDEFFKSKFDADSRNTACESNSTACLKTTFPEFLFLRLHNQCETMGLSKTLRTGSIVFTHFN
jgi:hypothetical protein